MGTESLISVRAVIWDPGGQRCIVLDTLCYMEDLCKKRSAKGLLDRLKGEMDFLEVSVAFLGLNYLHTDAIVLLDTRSWTWMIEFGLLPRQFSMLSNGFSQALLARRLDFGPAVSREFSFETAMNKLNFVNGLMRQ